MDFFAAIFVVAMRSLCLLVSMKPIHMPNCSLLNLHANDKNGLKSSLFKKIYI